VRLELPGGGGYGRPETDTDASDRAPAREWQDAAQAASVVAGERNHE